MLLTLSAALAMLGATPAPLPSQLNPVPSRDRSVVHRWKAEGDPRGVAVGADGTIYVGLARPQAVLAVDPKSGEVRRSIVLDSAEIASTKELVTLRTSSDGKRLFIANGSDESATILSLPDLGVVREITIEGESIRDVLPDPAGRYLYLLGRRVHVYDAAGEKELHVLPPADPMAIAANAGNLAVIATQDFGNAHATAVALYDTSTFRQLSNDPLETTDTIVGALFSADGSSVVALSENHLFEKPVARAPKTMTRAADGTMRMQAAFGDFVSSTTICLPRTAGPEILARGAKESVVFGERRCSATGSFIGSARRTAPASLYGIEAFALAYDPATDTVAVTDPAGYLTIYRFPARSSRQTPEGPAVE